MGICSYIEIDPTCLVYAVYGIVMIIFAWNKKISPK